MCGLHYEQASRRFKNTMDEQIKYGWEENPVQQTMTFDENFQAIQPPTNTSISYTEKDGLPFAAPIDGEVPF